MSMIFKTNTEETEIGSKEARIARMLGMEEELTKDEVIDVLNHVTVRLAAKGDNERYRKIAEVVAEIETWHDGTISVEL